MDLLARHIKAEFGKEVPQLVLPAIYILMLGVRDSIVSCLPRMANHFLNIFGSFSCLNEYAKRIIFNIYRAIYYYHSEKPKSLVVTL